MRNCCNIGQFMLKIGQELGSQVNFCKHARGGHAREIEFQLKMA